MGAALYAIIIRNGVLYNRICELEDCQLEASLVGKKYAEKTTEKISVHTDWVYSKTCLSGHLSIRDTCL